MYNVGVLNVQRCKQHLKNTKTGSTLPVHNAIRKYYKIDNTQNKVERNVIDKAYSLEELNNLEKKYTEVMFLNIYYKMGV